MLQKFNEKNRQIKVYVGDRLYDRNEAKVTVFDSSVQGGDAVWEGLRVYDGKVFSLDLHLQRLVESAKAMAFVDIPSKASIKSAIFKTLNANGMRDGVHVRLTLTRGEKITSGMDPRLNQFGSCLIILAEWKEPVYDSAGIRLITSSTRRNSPMSIDSKIHHNNLINNILAKIEANVAGADAALMLDIYGFASECNGTNVFMIKKGVVYTPLADACLPGITRRLVIDLSRRIGLDVIEKNISLTELYNADQVFVTGTMGELTNVYEIDGRKIEIDESASDLLSAIEKEFHRLVKSSGEPIPA
ncbi:MAG: aminotransferase class IV [Bacteroidota bacterium]